MLHTRTQKFCAWSGIVGVTLFFAGFLLAGFFPPPSPSWTQEQVVAHYQQYANGIRSGMLLMMASGMFIAPLVAVISVHLRRIEGGTPIMTYTQLSAGTAGILFFIIPGALFLITAFRPDRPPELTYMLNDFAWIMTVIVWPPAFMQNMAIGTAVLNDKSPNPIFPRWLAYLNFWVALLFVPGSLLAWFKSGPFAWNGLFAFWIPGTVFFIWFVAMLVVLLKVIERQAREASMQH